MSAPAGDAAAVPAVGRQTSGSVSGRVLEDLRRRLEAGEWPPGTRLPGEHQLAAAYAVSRATIRSALRSLESQGLTTTRHGTGTYATGGTGGIQADLRHLDSMTATIRRVGAEPGMAYRRREVRPATAEQAQRLETATGEPVLLTERKLTADGRLVAFSYDVIRRAVLPAELDVGAIEGSVYQLFEQHGVRIAWATAKVHATRGDDVGWGRRPRDAVYVLLDQVHRTLDNRPVAWSRSYYLEGGFQFSLVRTR